LVASTAFLVRNFVLLDAESKVCTEILCKYKKYHTIFASLAKHEHGKYDSAGLFRIPFAGNINTCGKKDVSQTQHTITSNNRWPSATQQLLNSGRYG
jgi:hypothetical protein